MADHGIRQYDSTCEADAFVSIGRHLASKGIPTAKIYLYDTFSGHVFMEDLGDIHFQTFIKSLKNQDRIVSHYKALIQLLGRPQRVQSGMDLPDRRVYRRSDPRKRMPLFCRCVFKELFGHEHQFQRS
jgi:aminoglycoside/choline kinase family phosphotransferase